MDSWMGSVLSGSVSAVVPRYLVGDTVEVLNAFRLPKVEEVSHVGVIERVEERGAAPTLYWISGLAVARTAPVLRLRLRGGR